MADMPQAAQVVPVNFAEAYERFLVPAIFRPWANDLLDRIRPNGAESLLDVACGTGIVARLLRERRGTGENITGVDANPEMIGVARALAPDVAWQTANALDLPFEAAAFELVVCQQGLQFFPDRAAAVRQMRRVLTAGGRVALSTWRPLLENPLLCRLHQLAVARFGEHDDRRFSFSNAEQIVTLLADAGFHDIRAETVTRAERLPDANTFIALNLTATIDQLDDMTPDNRAETIARFQLEAKSALASFVDDLAFVHPVSANIVTAIA
jgi:ubiquinone/menaquinone biosynthesis C-methylase UbiE